MNFLVTKVSVQLKADPPVSILTILQIYCKMDMDSKTFVYSPIKNKFGAPCIWIHFYALTWKMDKLGADQ